MSGAARDVELLTGHNRDEYRLFIAAPGRLGQITDDEANTVLDYFAPAPDGPAGYRKAYPDLDAGGLFEVAFSDWLFRMPTLHLAQAHAMSRRHHVPVRADRAGARPGRSAPATRSTSRSSSAPTARASARC